MASTWGYMKTVSKFIKKNVCKPVKNSVCKTVWRLCSCVRPSKHEEDPGFPEVKISYAEEGNPEMLAAESLLSLTDNEGVKETPLGTAGKEKDDGEKMNNKGSVNSLDLDTDAEADFNPGPISDSLEGIPDMLAEESLPSLMDNEEVKEAPLGATEKEKDDGEKMNDKGSVNSRDLDSKACPGQAECNPGPSSDRVPEPQRTSDKEQGDQGFDVEKLNPSSTYEDIHRLCKMYPYFSRNMMVHTADTVAQRHSGLMLEHFLTSSETVCDDLMFDVLFSPKCNISRCITIFIQEANLGSLVQDSETQLLNKVKAIRAIAAITRCTNNVQHLNPWLPYHFVTLANVLISQAQPMEKGTNKTFKKYMVPGEAIDILATLIQRLNLVGEMSSRLFPPQ